MKLSRISAWIALGLLSVFTQVFALEALPTLAHRANDFTGTLSAGQLGDLENRLRHFEDSAGSQVVIAVVPTTGEEAIEAYALRLVEAAKLGREKIDDGVLILVAKQDRHSRIEVGYGLEGVLPDARCKRILAEIMTPSFRTGDFYGGLSAAVTAVQSSIRGEALPLPKSRTRGAAKDLSPYVLALFLGLAVTSFLRLRLGRVFGTLASGGGFFGLAFWLTTGWTAFILVFVGLVLISAFDLLSSLGSSNFAHAGRSRGRGFDSFGGFGSGFGGSSWGGSSGGSSWGGGGGGSFGGGGASGDW